MRMNKLTGTYKVYVYSENEKDILEDMFAVMHALTVLVEPDINGKRCNVIAVNPNNKANAFIIDNYNNNVDKIFLEEFDLVTDEIYEDDRQYVWTYK